jgi:hypothetical protein
MLKAPHRAKETTTTEGLGALTLLGAASGFQTIVGGIGDGNSLYYMTHLGANWEINRGVVTDAASDTLSRAKFIASSSGSAISWPAGTKDVFGFIPPQALNGILLDDDVAAADLQLDWALDGTYEWYLLRWRNVRLSADGASLAARISIAASFKSDAFYQSDRLDSTESTVGVTSTTTGTSHPLTSDVDTGVAGAAISGWLLIENPNETAHYKHLTSRTRWRRNTSNAWFTSDVGGQYINSVAAVDQLRVFPSSGNIAEGKFRLFGGHY